MSSSYKSKIDFGYLLETIIFMKNPKTIVEFGILNGFSLNHFIKNSSSKCKIYAYDIFDDFNGNHSNIGIIKKYKQYDNVCIQYANFFEKYKTIPDNSIDILHIDIANNGDVYDYTMKHYISKMNKNGIIILEGGSEERDNVDWMGLYDKPKIQPVIEKYKNQYDIHVIRSYPSMTIVRL